MLDTKNANPSSNKMHSCFAIDFALEKKKKPNKLRNIYH